MHSSTVSTNPFIFKYASDNFYFPSSFRTIIAWLHPKNSSFSGMIKSLTTSSFLKFQWFLFKMIGLGPSFLADSFRMLSMQSGNICSIARIMLFARESIWLCERKLTVRLYFMGALKGRGSTGNYFLYIKLMSENLKDTPFWMAWAVSPE